MATVATQLNSGSGFASGEVVTATKLNNLVNTATVTGIVNADIDAAAAIAGSKLASGAITDTQLATGAVTGAAGGGKIAASAITAQTQLADPLASGDEFLVHDTSASALRRVAWSALQPAGSVLQTVAETTDATTTITNTFAVSTKPQYNAANIIMTKAIATSNAANKVLVTAVVSGYTSTGNIPWITALFNTTSGDAIAAAVCSTSAGYGDQCVLMFLHSPGSAATHTYRLGVGPATSTFYLNKRYYAADFDMGGLHISSMILQEIKG